MIGTVLAGLGVALAVALAWAYWQQRLRCATLHRQLDGAAVELQLGAGVVDIRSDRTPLGVAHHVEAVVAVAHLVAVGRAVLNGPHVVRELVQQHFPAWSGAVGIVLERHREVAVVEVIACSAYEF